MNEGEYYGQVEIDKSLKGVKKVFFMNYNATYICKIVINLLQFTREVLK